MTKNELEHEVQLLQKKITILELEKKKEVLEAEIEAITWKKMYMQIKEHGDEVLQPILGFQASPYYENVEH